MNVFSLWKYEMRATIRRPAPLFLAFLLPIIVLLMVISVVFSLFQDDRTLIQTAVVDQDQTFETKSLVHQLAEDERMKEAMNLTSMNKSKANEMFANEEVTAIIEIPKGFTKSLRSGENDPIKVITNQEQPLQSTLVNVLLESGANYISASQSAVNTVYDLHIKSLPEGEQEGKLQQLIVTFTLFALSRNEAFETELIPAGTGIGWELHGMISVMVTFLFLFSAIYQLADTRVEKKSMQLRLRSFNITSLHDYLIKSVKWFITISIVGLLFFLLSSFIERTPAFSWKMGFAIILSSLFLATFVSAFYSILKHSLIRGGALLLTGLFGIGVAGVWVPAIYLPDALLFEWNPFSACYVLFQYCVTDDSSITPMIFILLVWSIALWSFGCLLTQWKERRHAYLSRITAS